MCSVFYTDKDTKTAHTFFIVNHYVRDEPAQSQPAQPEMDSNAHDLWAQIL